MEGEKWGISPPTCPPSSPLPLSAPLGVVFPRPIASLRSSAHAEVGGPGPPFPAAPARPRPGPRMEVPGLDLPSLPGKGARLCFGREEALGGTGPALGFTLRPEFISGLGMAFWGTGES